MINDAHLEAILIQALTALETGETAEQVLACYPAEADQLEPMLRAAVRLTAYGQEALHATPTAPVKAHVAFLARAAAMQPQASPVLWLARLAHSRVLLSFLAAMVLILVIGGSVLGASAASLPGDPLYGVKRSVESLQLSLAFDPTQRVNLEESYSQRRVEEVKAMQASKRSASIEFVGSVEAMSASEWAVDGFVVQVIPSTIVEGAPQTGDRVKVTGRTLPDGQIVANRIESEYVDLAGVVEAMGAQMWVIGGQRVLVTKDTRVTGTPRLGAQVEAHALKFFDGTLLAIQIEFDDRDLPPGQSPITSTPGPGSPTSRLEPTHTPKPPKADEPTETPKPRSTGEPTVGATPRPPETDEPSRTPGPPQKPEPSRTPEPSHTPEPSRTSKPTWTPEPSHTPEPTRTPEQSRTPELSHTPGLSRTPQPSRTSEPTEMPEPTETREPTKTPKPK